MKQLKAASTISQPPSLHIELPKPKAKSRRGTHSDVTTASVADTHIRPSKGIIYETPKREHVQEDNDDDKYDDEFLKEEAKRFGGENVGPVAGPYLMPYIYMRQFLDTQYGMFTQGPIFVFFCVFYSYSLIYVTESLCLAMLCNIPTVRETRVITRNL
jgi:hypothetical protein